MDVDESLVCSACKHLKAMHKQIISCKNTGCHMLILLDDGQINPHQKNFNKALRGYECGCKKASR